MVMYNFKIEHFLFPQLSILCYLILITYFFSKLNPITFTGAISFNFTSFSASDSNITYEELLLKTKSPNSQATGSRSSWWVEPRISNLCNCGSRTLETSQISPPIFPLPLTRRIEVYMEMGLPSSLHLWVQRFLC